MTLIVKLHGTSGSGKSTVATGLMAMSLTEVKPFFNERGRTRGYNFHLPGFKYMFTVLGPYTTVCGGLDSINDSKEHIELLHRWAPMGHVFYEGLLGSEYYGEIGRQSERYGNDHIFAFMDTPVDKCVDRVKARRLAAGNKKLLNEDNTRGRIKKIERLKYRLEHELHRRTVLINHMDALTQVYNLYRNAECSPK